MENKNFLLAMGLIVSFLLLWSVFVVPRFTPPPAPPTASSTVADQGATSSALTSSDITSARADSGHTAILTDTTLRDENNEIVFTPKGGAVKSWLIKSKGQDVDLVLHPDAEPLPLSSFPQAIFKITARDHGAVMETTLANGVRVIKTLSLSTEGHLHTISYRFQNPTAQPISLSDWTWGWGPGLGTSIGEFKDNARATRGLTMGKIKAHTIKQGEHPEFRQWGALDNRYYLVAFIPKIVHPVEVTVEGAKDQTHLSLVEKTLVPAKSEVVLEYELYVGPKGFGALKKYNRGLEECVDFGMFTGLGRFILNILNHLKAVTGNYGVSIILLTMGLQLLMFPLTVKSFKATMAMKKLQPKIAELQARFKNDPKRLNVEMMNLYKSSGTNPFGGCLPMILQLPIFWALFTTLRNAYELRGAPFFGWVHDLSTPDVLMQIGTFPLHALPLIMGGAMFMQQRMSGAASDPTQKQMMMMMPIMFTFMFYGFPAGLVLYWLTNNLMTMGIQWSFQRFNQPAPASVIETTIVK